MKKLTLTVLIALLVALVVPSFALEHEFAISPELSHITYKEPGVMTEKGWFYGLTGSYTLKTDIGQNLKLAVGPELKLAKGTVKYSSSKSGSMSGIDDTLFEARLLGGVEWAFQKDMAVKPYIGFGYRSLVDDSEGKTTSTGALGYERWIRYYYIPVGVAYTYKFSDGWTFKAQAEYDWFIRGKVTSYLGYVPGYEDIKNTQKSGYGLRGSVEVSKNFKTWAVSAKPYIKYWNIKDSEVTVDSAGRAWIEPRNHSTEVGLGVTINF
ncbi:hypothetical protein [Thermodesulfovibrio yellowstonii]|uniref:hypothetical protein n=1 Tax=Thermodesulfovibrio yellowstonii TaxID=28262 RepID=UPI00040CFE6B|nr:hypothetical protein [Thermodesulfovibrio islandicus]